MCGILGYSHVSNRLPFGVLDRGLEALTHRGPDHQGQFSTEALSLGATRLRILDMAGGDQPLLSPDRDVAVAFNGEIFNHHEIRCELEQYGYTFSTTCDTEVVLSAFLHWGLGCFARLRGMFGLAIWIESERRLILARDQMGIKPLYYCVHQGEIFFASELKCIFAHPEVPRHISLDGLNCFLRLNYVPAPYTLVEGIRKLLPGHLLEWQDGRFTERSYLPVGSSLAAPRNIREATEELDDLLTKSVKEQLVSDVPVGIWLSGGLDSSTILHYASKISPDPVRTFSITFHGRTFDESEPIRQIQSHYGSVHEEFNLGEDVDLEGAIRQMSYFSDEPSADAGALPAWFLAEMTARNVTVVLSGEGSDELFAGYLTYKADRYAAMARKVPSALRHAALKAANLLPVSDDKISFEYKLKRFLQGSLLSPEQAHIYWNGTFSEAEKREFFRYADSTALDEVLRGMKTTSGLNRFLDFDLRYYLADDILYKVDRMSMAHSLEARPPFLDPRIVDFASRLPENFKLHGSKSKFVLRELMKDRLPAEIMRRPKIGFDIPVHDWLRGVLCPLLLDTISEDAVRASGLFHWTGVEKILADHLERRANLGYHLWGLMILLLWMKEWKIAPPLPVEDMTSLNTPAFAFDQVGSL